MPRATKEPKKSSCGFPWRKEVFGRKERLKKKVSFFLFFFFSLFLSLSLSLFSFLQKPLQNSSSFSPHRIGLQDDLILRVHLQAVGVLPVPRVVGPDGRFSVCDPPGLRA
jgi:hypothetical protein